MESLHEMQKKFGRVIRGGSPDSVLQHVIPGGSLSSEGALRVYREGYTARMTSLLGETYEGIWRVLGDEEFFQICRSYINEEDSRSYNLSDYGENFPSYLKESYPEHPWISDLASFEWIFKEVFHSRELPSADFSKADLSRPDQAFFRFGEDVKIVRLDHSVFEIWNNREDENYRLPSAEEISKKQCGFLYKKDGGIFFEDLETEKLAVIESLKEGRTIAQSLEESTGLGEEDVSALFSMIVSSGIVKEIYCSDS